MSRRNHDRNKEFLSVAWSPIPWPRYTGGVSGPRLGRCVVVLEGRSWGRSLRSAEAASRCQPLVLVFREGFAASRCRALDPSLTTLSEPFVAFVCLCCQSKPTTFEASRRVTTRDWPAT